MIDIVDAHCHYSKNLLDVIKSDDNLHFLFSGSTRAQCDEILNLRAKFSQVRCSLGIHPWYSDTQRLYDFLDYLNQCDVIGEIGMDSEWCDIDFDIQRKMFISQLDIAESMNKPVIIHGKGMEREISEILQNYSMKKVIHWYSSLDYPDEYIEQDCYFTVGPDFLTNQSVQNVISRVDISRLLVETDGIDAIAWCRIGEFDQYSIRPILMESIEYISKVKQMGCLDVAAALISNYYGILD